MDDTRAIEAVLVRYATGIDTRDWELFRTCFTADAAIDYGDIGTWTGADEITGFMDAAHIGFAATNHMMSNFSIDVDGDRATARSYVHVVLAFDGGWIDGVGTYDDSLVRVGEGWQIASRRFRSTRMTSGKDG